MRLGDEPFKDMMDSSLTPGKQESSKGYTTNLVCTNCNNTWMSRLENQVKQILVKNNKIIESKIQKTITEACQPGRLQLLRRV